MIRSKQKRLLHFILLIWFLNGIFITFAMEEEKSEIKELSLLPREIGSIILGYVGSQCAGSFIHKDDQPEEHYTEKCYVLIPILIDTHKLEESFFLPNNHRYYSCSKNMNSLDLIKSQFPLLCGLLEDHSQKYYKVLDRFKRRRYLKYEESEWHQIQLFSFDGINDNGIFLITDYFPQQNPKTSNFYLGRMTESHGYILEKPDNASFDYELKDIPGKISDAALCKSANRCVLLNGSEVTVYDIMIDEQNNILPISSAVGTTPTAIKKISFITPTTLLALSKKGKLFIIAADQEKPMQFFKQRIKKENKTPILLSYFAVDPCYPHHILLHSYNNECLYWDIKSKRISKIMEFTEEIQNPNKKETIYNETKNLWFYNDKFGRYYIPLNLNDNFQIYSFIYNATDNQEIDAQLIYSAPKTIVTPFEKKKKKDNQN